MIGVYDFCGHYEWTFAWLDKIGGDDLVRDYWREAIGGDSQRHASDLILKEGIDGMAKYWGHTLAEESPEQGYAITRTANSFRIDMHDCPSKGFLLRNGLEQYRDYCDHCIGWIGPVMQQAGYVIDHEHNHCGQCWWEMKRAGQENVAATDEALADGKDVRDRPEWHSARGKVDLFRSAIGPAEKLP